MQMAKALLNILWNIVGGIIVAILIVSWQSLRKRLRYRAFRRVFGDDIDRFYVIYPEYLSPSRDTRYEKPPSSVNRSRVITFNLSTVNSSATTRGIGHIAYAIGTSSYTQPIIRSDIETDPLMDISFVAVGGNNNNKSLDVLKDAANHFVQFKGPHIVSKQDETILAPAERGTDCGFILKIYPEHNPDRTWLCVAGLGEWGTSGAAWWLSKHWKMLAKRAKDRPFVCITRTRIGSDDSTQLLDFKCPSRKGWLRQLISDNCCRLLRKMTRVNSGR